MTPAHPDHDSSTAYRRFMRHWPTGVAVLGVNHDARRCGATVNTLVSLSLNPPLISLALTASSRADKLLQPGVPFTVSVLAEGQCRVAQWFSATGRRLQRDEFAPFPTRQTAEGLPYLAECTGYLDCTVTNRVPSGDHVIVVSRVVAHHELTGDPPLVFVNGGFTFTATSGALF